MIILLKVNKMIEMKSKIIFIDKVGPVCGGYGNNRNEKLTGR